MPRLGYLSSNWELHVFLTPAGETLRVCCGCGEPKPLDAFGLHSKRTRRHRGRCRTCYNAYMREFRRQRRLRRMKGYLRRLRLWQAQSS